MNLSGPRWQILHLTCGVQVEVKQAIALPGLMIFYGKMQTS